MCSRPQDLPPDQYGEVVTVACRSCDQCIAVRRHGWVARAMAEKSMWNHTLCLALTYNDETQESRDGAQMFAYADVRAFLNRVRSAARDRAKRNNETVMPRLKFLVAGEQGSRNGRCHWHAIIYSDVDIRTLGDITIKRTLQTPQGPVRKDVVLANPREMLTVGKRKKRLNWSLWGMGFVTFQEPDQGGMHYVLSYCLKDQFTSAKSEGTMREAKAENFATGLFRMSKRPAIGESWIIQKMERLVAANAVLPSLQITIPGFRGYWFPSGSARERILWHLKAVANLVTWRTGEPPPQMPGLLNTLSDNPSDMEILLGAFQQDKETSRSVRFAGDEKGFSAARRSDKIKERCGSILPCKGCLDRLNVSQLKAYGLARDFPEDGGYAYNPVFGAPQGGVSTRQKTPLGAVNPYCRRSAFADVQAACAPEC